MAYSNSNGTRSDDHGTPAGHVLGRAGRSVRDLVGRALSGRGPAGAGPADGGPGVRRGGPNDPTLDLSDLNGGRSTSATVSDHGRGGLRGGTGHGDGFTWSHKNTSPVHGSFVRAHDSHPVIDVDDPSTDRAALSGVALLSVVTGGLAAWAQGFLPEAIQAFGASPTGWSVITVLIVWAVQARPVLAAVLGAISFVLLSVGYVVVSVPLGSSSDPALFSMAALVLGPVVGVATAWLRSEGVHLALATAVLSGIGVGEGLYGFTEREDTSAVYWTLTVLGGLALLGVMVARRIKGSTNVTLAVGLTSVTAMAFVLGYQALADLPLLS